MEVLQQAGVDTGSGYRSKSWDEFTGPEGPSLSVVITVCDAAHEELTATTQNAVLGWLHWSIPDPARTGQADAFDRVVEELTSRIDRVAPAVRSAHPSQGS